jgi:penicillin-binding protein-related factor A (putative recombinase)
MHGSKRGDLIMNEAVFAGEIKRSLKHYYPHGFYLKIPDSFGTDSKDDSDTRFTPPKYLDAIFFVDQMFFGFEYKQHKSSRAFPLSKVRDIQEESLGTIFSNGGQAYFVINVRYKGESRVNVAVFISILEWLELKERFSHRKSIPLDAILEHTTLNTERVDGKTIWSLRPIIY